MSDYLAPSQECWYGPGLPFRCTRCGHCCSGAPGYVWVTTDEARELADLLDLSFETFAREHLRNVGGLLSLRESPSGRCAFQDSENLRCRVYSRRPGQCRSYPFWPSITESPATWNREAKQCPGMREDALVSSAEIRALQRPPRIG